MIKKAIKKVLEYSLIVLVFCFGMTFNSPNEPVFIYQEINNNIKEVVTDLQNSTAYIEVDGINYDWSGSGVLIDKDKGIIMTAGHVVEDANSFVVKFKDGTVCESTISYKEKNVDVGFISVCPNSVSHLINVSFAPAPEIGDDVYICGAPFGEQLSYSVSFGKVSGISRNFPYFGKMTMIQSDAQSWPGNSGGPVVNVDGNLVGILVGGMRYTDGISLIVPSRPCELSLQKYCAELGLFYFLSEFENAEN